MTPTEKHYHGWILRIDGAQAAFEAMPGQFSDKTTCRRHAYKAAGCDMDKVIVLMCRGEDQCPTKLEMTSQAA